MTHIVNHNQNVSSSPLNTTTSTTITRVAHRGAGGGSGGNGSQACAACKYQRRRCAPDCLLAPYFPVERNKEFLNVHKLFGVSNLLKLLKNVQPFQRDTTMKSLIFEANIRAGDPVGGCYRIIMNLQRLINFYETELQFTYNEIFRVQAVDIQNNINRTTVNTNTNNVQVMNSIGGFHRSEEIDGFGDYSMSGFGESSKRINSISSLNSQIIKIELLDDFKDEFAVKPGEFETKVAISSSKDKQSVVENGDLKPYFGKNCQGKALASDDDKVVSNTRVN
ncbi:LOB domain-containing protein 12-like [Solanum pennellii]|uniref:LOB domain-containing protein 12-like n=1 Tax=Solanum pennellii TaxID=28526 RepID=A0ABM1VG71_SOLPN|nr:LOB domain-containing protein 12-like [Solanum pennellii]